MKQSFCQIRINLYVVMNRMHSYSSFKTPPGHDLLPSLNLLHEVHESLRVKFIPRTMGCGAYTSHS